MTRFSLISLFGAFLLALPLVLPAQDAPGTAQDEIADEIYIEQVNVNVVNVEVYVTDRDGKPILGLGPEDFEIFENDQPMKVSNFFAVENGRVKDETGAEVGSDEGPQLPAHLQPIEVPEEQRLRLIVYVDNFNIRPFNRNRVIRELRQFLQRNVQREDRVMLVSYDRSLKVRQGFTSDPRVVNAALSELERVSAFAVHTDSERRQVMDDIDDAQDAWEALGRVRSYAESVANDLSFTIKSLKEMVESLAGMPGRKAILYVSDGIPMVPAEELFHYVENRFSRSGALTEAFSYDHSRRFRELTGVANANGVTFYTIDAGGLRTDSQIAASERGGPNRGAFIDTISTHNLQNTLHFMADATGGRAIVNRNRVLPALQEVVQSDFRNYYSLGYSPAHSGDGRMYEIEVKLKDRERGVDVRHRENYRDKTITTRMFDGTRASLNFAFESNPLDVSVSFGRGTPRAQDRYYQVPVVVKFPLDKVILVPRGEQYVARLRLYVAAMDNEGGMSEVQEIRVPIDIPSAEVERAKQQQYAYTMELIMRAGNQRVAVGLRDEFGSNQGVSFVSRSARVGG